MIVRDKLLLFSSAFGGSLFAMKSDALSQFFEVVFGVGAILSFIGVLVNLAAMGKLSKELERIKND